MKITKSLLILALPLLFASQAMAGGYVVTGVGPSDLQRDCGSIACDTTSVGGKVVVGRELVNGLSAELGYVYYGRATADILGITAKAQGHSVGVGLAYTADLWCLEGTVRGGVAANMARISTHLGGVTISDEKTTAQPYAGVALAYRIKKNTSVGVGLDATRFEYGDSKGTARLLTLNVRQSF